MCCICSSILPFCFFSAIVQSEFDTYCNQFSKITDYKIGETENRLLQLQKVFDGIVRSVQKRFKLQNQMHSNLKMRLVQFEQQAVTKEMTLETMKK